MFVGVVIHTVVLGGVVGLPPRFVMDEQGQRALVSSASPDGSQGAFGAVEPAWAALGPFGGDVQAVAASPTASMVVLAGIAPAGSSGGSMYRSTDGGATWSEVGSLSGNSVYDIAFAPDGTVYAATFDGVWKSGDDGASFTQTNLNIGLNDQTYAIEIDPNDPQTLFCGVADALGSQPVNVLRSTNGGTSWQNVTPPMGTPMGCQALVFDPTNSAVVYAGFAGGFGGGALWVSTTGGNSWVNRSAGLPNTPVQDLAHDGARVVVSGGQLFGSQNFGVFESFNMGQTWAALHDGSWPSLVINNIEFDPADDDVLLAASAGAGVFRSTDAGETWTFGIGGSGGLSLNDVRFEPGDSQTIYLGASSIAVLKSADGGGSFTPSSVGIGALNTFSVAVNPLDSSEMAVGFQGLNDGGVYSSTDGGVTWDLESAPGTRYSTVAFSPDGTLYAVSAGPSSIAPEGLYRRDGDSWTSLGPDQGNLFESELVPVEFSQNDPDLIMMGGSDFGVAGAEPTVWRSTTAGEKWDKVYEGPIENEDVSDIEIVEDGSDMNMVATFTDFGEDQTGGVLVSDDNGQSWEPGGSGLAAAAEPVRLGAIAGSPSSFLLADSDVGAGLGGVWLTEDAGASFVKTSSAGSVRGLATDPTDSQVSFISLFGDPAVEISEDGGSSYSPFVSDALDTAGTPRDLVIGGGRLLYATGTGVYASPLGCAADVNGDGELNVLDFVAFQSGFVSQDPAADCDGNGVFNILDFVCYQSLFAAGCS